MSCSKTLSQIRVFGGKSWFKVSGRDESINRGNLLVFGKKYTLEYPNDQFTYSHSVFKNTRITVYEFEVKNPNKKNCKGEVSLDSLIKSGEITEELMISNGWRLFEDTDVQGIFDYLTDQKPIWVMFWAGTQKDQQADTGIGTFKVPAALYDLWQLATKDQSIYCKQGLHLSVEKIMKHECSVLILDVTTKSEYFFVNAVVPFRFLDSKFLEILTKNGWGFQL